MIKRYTGKQVIKAGETLLEDNVKEFETAMDILSYWRFSHEAPLGEALKLLQETTLKIDKFAFFAKRLKRYASIVSKLRRFRKMKLKNMQDIGGCRAIVSNLKKLKKVVRELRKKPEFKTSEGKIRFKDYIGNPKEDGYRGYHLIGQFKDKHGNKKDIEVQVRTKLQHDWATALEIVDLFTGQALKSNQGDDDWKKFFSCVSEQFAVMEDIPLFDKLEDQEKFKKYRKIINESQYHTGSCFATTICAQKLKVIDKFDAFTHSLKIVDGKLEKETEDGYVLVIVDTAKKTVQTHFFNHKKNKEAEKEYIEAEKGSAAGKGNIVVALVSSTAVGGIKEAYPNYFADSTEFLSYLNFIFMALLPEDNHLIRSYLNS